MDNKKDILNLILKTKGELTILGICISLNLSHPTVSRHIDTLEAERKIKVKRYGLTKVISKA